MFRKRLFALIMIVSLIFILLLDGLGVQAQTTNVQFGNLNWNANWNLAGGVVVASKFTIDSSMRITMMSYYTQDNSPPSYVRLGIFSDNIGKPNQCIASTDIKQAQVGIGWQTIPLSHEILLQPGQYWLAQVDSGASVIKYMDVPGGSPTIYSEYLGSSSFYNALDVGHSVNYNYQPMSGTLAIIASFGPPDLTGLKATYAMGAQCWTSGSGSDPYPVQTTFSPGQRVYIYWMPYSPSAGVVDIKVYAPGATIGVSVPYSSFSAVKSDVVPVSFTPSISGTWVVVVNGYSTFFTVVPVFVVPEYPLGALFALFSCFVCFIISKKRLKK